MLLNRRRAADAASIRLTPVTSVSMAVTAVPAPRLFDRSAVVSSPVEAFVKLLRQRAARGGG